MGVHTRTQWVRDDGVGLGLPQLIRSVFLLLWCCGADNIESNMSQTENNVDSGVEQLRKASRYQKKGRNKMCCMLGILVIVLAVIVLVILSSKK